MSSTAMAPCAFIGSRPAPQPRAVVVVVASDWTETEDDGRNYRTIRQAPRRSMGSSRKPKPR